MRKWIALIVAVLTTLSGCQTYQGGMTLPSPKYLEHPPQYIPPSSPQEAVVPAVAKLTVANVLKEEAMLFLVTKDGLTFVRMLPHGEAVDLDAKTGQRYAAVFATAPHQVGHEVKASGETWLLRRPARFADPLTGSPARPLVQ